MQSVPSYSAGSEHPEFRRLVEIIRILRSPGGCPWDLEQTHASIQKHVVEEAYEVQDAIDKGDTELLCEELGDLLEQVVLHAQIAADAGEFTVDDVCKALADKMIRRHPHVFYESQAELDKFFSENDKNAGVPKNAREVLSLWDQVKLMEHAQKRAAQQAGVQETLMSSIPTALPALMQATKISRKAVSVGFDWNDCAAVWDQIEEELAEFKAEAPGTPERMMEFGDLLFTLVNLARKEGFDPEEALKASNKKFIGRFDYMERAAAEQGKHLNELTVDEQEVLWNEAKKLEK